MAANYENGEGSRPEEADPTQTQHVPEVIYGKHNLGPYGMTAISADLCVHRQRTENKTDEPPHTSSLHPTAITIS